MWTETHNLSNEVYLYVFGDGPRTQENHLYTISVCKNTADIEIHLRGEWVSWSDDPRGKDGFHRDHTYNLHKYMNDLPSVILKAINNILEGFTRP